MTNINKRAKYWSSKTVIIIAALLLHIALAFAGRAFPLFSTLHALVVIGGGILVAAFSKHNRHIAWVTAYIIGAELFWRMTQASIFYETGKYAIIVILLIGFLRNKKKASIVLPILYFALLTISIPLTLNAHSYSERARQLISFNLSGPLALAVSVLYFSQIKLNLQELHGVAWAATFPVFSIFTISMYSTFTAENLEFSTESNFITSGGFGPNQVSAMLGLGAVFMLIILLTSTNKYHILLSTLLLVGFIAQGALTFSRGGLFNFAACVLTVAFHQVFLQKKKSGGFILFLGILLVGFYFLYPQIDQFTGGKLTQRYQEGELGGRDTIALTELQVWKENPLFGVGPGEAAYHTSERYGQYTISHTEYTRLFSEHGIPGIFALILLIIICVHAYLKSPGWNSKILVAALIVWSLVEMSHAAMRIAAISYLIGLAYAIWVPDSTVSSQKSVRKK